MAEHPNIERRRIRMLYSLKDFQLALSAAEFLSECDPDGDYSKVELRRFKCYETTTIVSYGRPFSESKGGLPKLSLKMIGVQLDDSQKALHDEVIQMRNKVIAHSDVDRMRMLLKLRHSEFEPEAGFKVTIPVVFPEFDEGLDFLGHRIDDLFSLYYIVMQGLFVTLMNDARHNPERFNVHVDWISPTE